MRTRRHGRDVPLSFSLARPLKLSNLGSRQIIYGTAMKLLRRPLPIADTCERHPKYRKQALREKVSDEKEKKA